MNRIKNTLLVCIFLLLAINSWGCSRADETPPSTSPITSPSVTQSTTPPRDIFATELPGTNWVVVSVNGTKLDEGTNISLVFSDSGTFYGDVICNYYGGKYVAGDNNSLKMTDVMITLLLCQEGNREQADSCLHAFSLVSSFKFTQKYLVLMGKDDRELVTLQLQ